MIATALVSSVRDGSFSRTFGRNIVAGMTVGVVALPLSMGLAIASGVPPQHGLYTAIIGGMIIALTGGSRINISGPTAAFVVILLPVVQQYGLGGLLMSGLLAGLILIGLGLLRVGRFIQAIPYPVVIGFTAGIGTVIAFLQLKDLFGIAIAGEQAHFLDRAVAYARAIDTVSWEELAVGATSLAAVFGWKRVKSRIPGYLVALVWGTLLAAAMNASGSLPPVETIATRFQFSIGDLVGAGIPPVLPAWTLPWQLPGPDGGPIGLSTELLRTLFHAAFAIAILGALESLLCAVVADGMTGEQHDPDGELIGQGLGNVVVPFFGGIPVTAAIARTALNARTGGSTPVAAIVHSLFVLAAILALAPALSLIPMAAMAAVLVAVAWNMSEPGHVVHLVRNAPKADVAVFATCYGLTVLVDMQVAIAAGMVLAAVMFIRRMSELSSVSLMGEHSAHKHLAGRPGVVFYDINGPMFFGAAHKALKIITSVDLGVRVVVLDMADVPAIDTTAMVNLRSAAELLAARRVALCLLHTAPELEAKMRRFGLGGAPGGLRFIASPDEVPLPQDARPAPA